MLHVGMIWCRRSPLWSTLASGIWFSLFTYIDTVVFRSLLSCSFLVFPLCCFWVGTKRFFWNIISGCVVGQLPSESQIPRTSSLQLLWQTHGWPATSTNQHDLHKRRAVSISDSKGHNTMLVQFIIEETEKGKKCPNCYLMSLFRFPLHIR